MTVSTYSEGANGLPLLSYTCQTLMKVKLLLQSHLCSGQVGHSTTSIARKSAATVGCTLPCGIALYHSECTHAAAQVVAGGVWPIASCRVFMLPLMDVQHELWMFVLLLCGAGGETVFPSSVWKPSEEEKQQYSGESPYASLCSEPA